MQDFRVNQLCEEITTMTMNTVKVNSMSPMTPLTQITGDEIVDHLNWMIIGDMIALGTKDKSFAPCSEYEELDDPFSDSDHNEENTSYNNPETMVETYVFICKEEGFQVCSMSQFIISNQHDSVFVACPGDVWSKEDIISYIENTEFFTDPFTYKTICLKRGYNEKDLNEYLFVNFTCETLSRLWFMTHLAQIIQIVYNNVPLDGITFDPVYNQMLRAPEDKINSLFPYNDYKDLITKGITQVIENNVRISATLLAGEILSTKSVPLWSGVEVDEILSERVACYQGAGKGRFLHIKFYDRKRQVLFIIYFGIYRPVTTDKVPVLSSKLFSE